MRHVPHLLLGRPWHDDTIPLDEARHHHVSTVLRLKDGAEVHYTDGAGTVGVGRLAGDVVDRGVEQAVPAPVPVDLVVAPPKARDRARFLVEKAVEVGASSLRWIRTERTQGRPPKPAKARAWADGALEQCRGAWRLEFGDTSWDDLGGRFLVARPEGRPIRPVDAPTTVVVGPEGGFSDEEVPNRGEAVTLGGRILRTETAAVVAVALLRNR